MSPVIIAPVYHTDSHGKAPSDKGYADRMEDAVQNGTDRPKTTEVREEPARWETARLFKHAPVFIAMIWIVAVLAVLIASGRGITRSTISRERLDPGSVTLSEDWYDDSSMGWISSGRVLEDGLKDFYNETGVQPYLVITDQINGNYNPSGDEAWEYADQVYDQLFKDEGHMVFVFQCEDGGVDYIMSACTGAQAKAVLDDAEALEILCDYVDHYLCSNLDEDEMFAKAFSDAGRRIMEKQMAPGTQIVILTVIAAVAAMICLFLYKRMRDKMDRAAETERILNTPLEKFGNTEIEELKGKYQ